MPDVPKGYKMTEVGVIPGDWSVVSLGKLIVDKPKYGINAPAMPHDSRFPTYLRITDISDNGHFITEMKASVNHPLSGSYFLRGGDLVFARTGASVGKSYLYDSRDGQLVFAGFLIRITPDTDLLVPRFLWQYARSQPYWTWVQTNSMRSGQPGINSTEYSSLPVPIPPTMAEQQAIATALGDADALVESLERLIAKKRQVKQGAMQELLTGTRRLPGFCGEWETKRLGDVAEVVGGGTPSTAVSEYWNGDVDWFTPTEIGGAKYSAASARKITRAGLANSSAKMLPAKTVLMTTRASIGDLMILTSEATTNQGFQSLVTKDDTDHEFIYYMMMTKKTELLKNASGSTFLEISPLKVKSIELLVPEHAEQSAIAAVLSDMDAEIEALEARLAKARLVKQGMMQELLTGRIRLV